MTLHPCRFSVSGAVVAVAVRQIVRSRLTFRQNVQRELSSWESNLGRRICENCEPFLEAAEIALVKEHSLWHERAYGFVGYAGDKAVSTATAIINESCLFLFLVATMPEARRKGYGEAVVRLALQTAYEATGISRTVLHATEAGYPLYLRLGYQPTVKFMGCMLES
jgi:GNAT superfamily N-acetyltransferase